MSLGVGLILGVIATASVGGESTLAAQIGAVPVNDSCIVGPFELTFDRGSARLTNQHRNLLELVRAQRKFCGNEMLIESYPAEDGPADLQRRRAFAVYDYMARRGAATGRVAVGLQSQKWLQYDENARSKQVQVFLAIWR